MPNTVNILRRSKTFNIQVCIRGSVMFLKFRNGLSDVSSSLREPHSDILSEKGQLR